MTHPPIGRHGCTPPTPHQAAKIQALYPGAVKVGLDSGHCPHDDTPAEANAALLEWLASLQASGDQEASNTAAVTADGGVSLGQLTA